MHRSLKSNLVHFSIKIRHPVATISVIFLRHNLPNFVQYHSSVSSDIAWGNGVSRFPKIFGEWHSLLFSLPYTNADRQTRKHNAICPSVVGGVTMGLRL